jgi:DNA topoisomerase I
MAKNLVIVESPAKAKTIEGFLGKDFVVKSSFGHIRDLKSKELSIDVENNFTPTYAISADKKSIVSELKKLADQSETVWLATDEDREGEAISWHLFEVLGLKEDQTKRIVFHEITKPAILKAVENPRSIDKNLVDAQQARRVLDRLVGFEVSPVLWKKVKPALSAGRVQSVAVRLVVEREKEIQNFISTYTYRVTVDFLAKSKQFKAELNAKFQQPDDVRKFLETCIGANYTVQKVEKKPAKKSPSAPFTTSTLQQEASRKLGYSVSRTMSLAQKLYESGKITYMRTDSMNLSSSAIDAAKAEITKLYGEEFTNPRQYVTKSKGAQEAHEAIRPTYMNEQNAGANRDEQRLYDLIWKRTIASQMADAKLEKTNVDIAISTNKNIFQAQGEVLKFEGFLKVYMESTDDEDDEKEENTMLPPLSEGDQLEPKEMVATQKFTHHPPRYSEASLVKKLEEKGIGRPSTYAPTISTIIKREYVVKEEREGVERSYEVFSLKNDKITSVVKKEITGKEKGKLYPTDIGIVVNDFLVENFESILDYEFTANVEKEFDDIAEGKRTWNEMIKQFYKPFHQLVEKTMDTSEKATGERLLGNDPKTGEAVIARIGRFGPMIQIGHADNEQKPRFASLRGNLNIQNVTLEQALELFKLPRKIGVHDGEELIASVGKFGPYVKFKNSFVSIPKDEDPLTITLARAVELLEAKLKADSEKIIKTFTEDPTAQILNGKWGPYLKVGKNNYKLPKGTDANQLTWEECQKIVGEAPAKPKTFKAKGKK